MSRVLIIFLLFCPALAWCQDTEVAAAPSLECAFDVKIAWKSGQVLAFKPRVMVANDKTGEVKVESGPKEATPWTCRIQIHPKLEGQQIHLQIQTDLTSGSQTFHRDLDLTTIDGADNTFKDSNPQGDFSMKLTARVHNP